VHIDGFTIKGASYFWCSGILLNSNNCIISNNTFEGNVIGIWIHPPSLGNNVIRNNKFSSSSGYSPSIALYIESAGNKIYLNNFMINPGEGGGPYFPTFWNSTSKITYTYSGNTFTNYLGNYWDDYKGSDADNDGIGDTFHSIDSDKDNYPLVERFENYKEINQIDTINFSGHTWSVRHSSESPQGPGNNYWSNSTENIWVDDEGQLHLKITYNRRNGKWYCPEIFSQESFGYGKYVFYVASRVDNFDENVVGGLFTYEGRGETTPKEYEIDIEFSRWGVETNNNSLHVFQYRIADGDPATDDEPNEIDPNSFNISLNGEYSTHTFVWKNDYLHFQSYHGHYDNLPSEDYLISEKIWEDTRIPPESEEKVHLNLWLVNGNPPSDPEQSVEIIIKMRRLCTT
jgi:parallel beta-helix repeat protein